MARLSYALSKQTHGQRQITKITGPFCSFALEQNLHPGSLGSAAMLGAGSLPCSFNNSLRYPEPSVIYLNVIAHYAGRSYLNRLTDKKTNVLTSKKNPKPWTTFAPHRTVRTQQVPFSPITSLHMGSTHPKNNRSAPPIFPSQNIPRRHLTVRAGKTPKPVTLSHRQ